VSGDGPLTAQRFPTIEKYQSGALRFVISDYGASAGTQANETFGQKRVQANVPVVE
jgi:hypothetical protein